MNYKKTVAFMMISTTMLGTIGTITAHADTTGQLPVAQQADQNQVVNIPDSNLKKALNENLGQASEAQITIDQLATIKELDVNNKEIQSIDGLQYCVNLRKLIIGNDFMHTHETNTISDLSPLKNLTQLTVLVAGNLKISDFSPLKSLPLTYCTDEDMSGSYLGTQTVEIALNTDKYTELTLKNPMIDSQGKVITPDSISTDGTFNYQYDPKTNNFSLNYRPVYKDSKEKEEKLAFAGDDFKNKISYTKNTDIVHGRMSLVLSTHVNSLFEKAENLLNQMFKDSAHTLFKENVTQKDFLKIFNIEQELSEKYPTSGFMHKNEVQEFTKKLHDATLLFTTQETESLFLNGSETVLANGVTQQKIDTVRDDVNQLLKNDQENQELLLKKITKAQQLLNEQQSVTQTIGFEGQTIAGKADFARVSLVVKDHKASVIKHSNYQFHWNGWKSSKYASIKLTDPNGKVLYENSWRGNEKVQGNYGTIAQSDLPEGSSVEVYHAEGPWHRFATSDNASLKTKLGKTGYTYTYKMQNNQLVLMNVK
ncbi:toxin Cry1Ac domain D-VI-related protein [Enterococcus lactis]|uniref:toxin Cry1Ac domain D-VI-related protein n=1 Tax=Enterococcus lactis TaxID=357441 RepID=UPI004042E9B6